jgi:hypothetical protein
MTPIGSIKTERDSKEGLVSPVAARICVIKSGSNWEDNLWKPSEKTSVSPTRLVFAKTDCEGK